MSVTWASGDASDCHGRPPGPRARVASPPATRPTHAHTRRRLPIQIYPPSRITPLGLAHPIFPTSGVQSDPNGPRRVYVYPTTPRHRVRTTRHALQRPPHTFHRGKGQTASRGSDAGPGPRAWKKKRGASQHTHAILTAHPAFTPDSTLHTDNDDATWRHRGTWQRPPKNPCLGATRCLIRVARAGGSRLCPQRCQHPTATLGRALRQVGRTGRVNVPPWISVRSDSCEKVYLYPRGT